MKIINLWNDRDMIIIVMFQLSYDYIKAKIKIRELYDYHMIIVWKLLYDYQIIII